MRYDFVILFFAQQKGFIKKTPRSTGRFAPYTEGDDMKNPTISPPDLMGVRSCLICNGSVATKQDTPQHLITAGVRVRIGMAPQDLICQNPGCPTNTCENFSQCPNRGTDQCTKCGKRFSARIKILTREERPLTPSLLIQRVQVPGASFRQPPPPRFPQGGQKRPTTNPAPTSLREAQERGRTGSSIPAQQTETSSTGGFPTDEAPTKPGHPDAPSSNPSRRETTTFKIPEALLTRSRPPTEEQRSSEPSFAPEEPDTRPSIPAAIKKRSGVQLRSDANVAPNRTNRCCGDDCHRKK